MAKASVTNTVLQCYNGNITVIYYSFVIHFNYKACPQSKIMSASVLSNNSEVFSLFISLYECLLQQKGANTSRETNQYRHKC